MKCGWISVRALHAQLIISVKLHADYADTADFKKIS